MDEGVVVGEEAADEEERDEDHRCGDDGEVGRRHDAADHEAEARGALDAEADAEADGQVVKVVRPFAVALMLNSLCSSVVFPRLLDTAPSHWGLRPDWLASELTLLYALADLAGRAFSKEFVAFCQSKAAIRDWQRSQGARTAIWVSTIRGVFISSFILLAVACGWEDDSLFIFYVLFTGLSNGILVVGCLQQGACVLNSVELRAKSNGPYLVCASLLGVGDALGCVIGFTLASGIWV